MSSSDPAYPPLLDTPPEGVMDWDKLFRQGFGHFEPWILDCRAAEAARRVRHG